MILHPSDASKSSQDGLKCGQDGPKIAPRRLQDLPKTILKTFLLHRLFRLRFWSVLAPTWAPFDPPLGAQDGPKIDAKNVRKSRCRKMASKIAPRRPKMAPRRPRTPQRAPQDPPDPPKCAPRASKIAPRALKFAPRASKSSRDVERKVANKHCNFKSENHAQSKAARRSPRRNIRRPHVRRPRTKQSSAAQPATKDQKTSSQKTTHTTSPDPSRTSHIGTEDSLMMISPLILTPQQKQRLANR